MVCQICLNGDRPAIDAAIVRNRECDQALAVRFRTSISSIKKHRKHLPELLERQYSPSPVVIAPTYNVHIHVYTVQGDPLEEPENTGAGLEAVAAEGVGG